MLVKTLTNVVVQSHVFVLPVEVRATCGLLSAEAGFGFCEKKKKGSLYYSTKRLMK